MSILPGAKRSLHGDEDENFCEHEDCNEKACGKVAGEVDSMGVEWEFYCENHINERVDAIRNTEEVGSCEWCGEESDNLRPYRDIDEGSNGPVYDVCPSCRQKQSDRVSEELDSYPDEEDDGVWPVDDDGAADDLDPDSDLFDTDDK